jgi:hypothetical protein
MCTPKVRLAYSAIQGPSSSPWRRVRPVDEGHEAAVCAPELQNPRGRKLEVGVIIERHRPRPLPPVSWPEDADDDLRNHPGDSSTVALSGASSRVERGDLHHAMSNMPALEAWGSGVRCSRRTSVVSASMWERGPAGRAAVGRGDRGGDANALDRRGAAKPPGGEGAPTTRASFRPPRPAGGSSSVFPGPHVRVGARDAQTPRLGNRPPRE